MIESNLSEPRTESTTSSSMTEAKPENNETIKISDVYHLIIGFEVNFFEAINTQSYTQDSAFNKNTNTQNLNVDYGHNYFLTVKNGIVNTFFSFGPGVNPHIEDEEEREQSTYANPPYIKRLAGVDEFSGKRPGTTEYTITERSEVFIFKISKNQFELINKYSSDFKEKVYNQVEKYTAYLNDTCAEAAKEILDKAEIKLPDGKGHVITPSSKANTLIKYNLYVTPYSWYFQLLKKYGEPYIIVTKEGFLKDEANTELGEHYYTLIDGWVLKPGLKLQEQDGWEEYNINFKNHGDLNEI